MNIDHVDDHNEFDNLYTETLKKKIADKKTEDIESENESARDIEKTDDQSSDGDEFDIKDSDDGDKSEDDKSDETKKSLECMYSDISLEGGSNNNFNDSGKSISILGIGKSLLLIGRGIANRVYKIFKIIYDSRMITQGFYTLKLRIGNGFKDDISRLREIVKLLDDNAEISGSYVKPTIVNRLTVGDSIDLNTILDNYGVYNNALVEICSSKIAMNSKDIRSIIIAYKVNTHKIAKGVMASNLYFDSLTRDGDLDILDNPTEYTKVIHGIDLLPGNRRLLSIVPLSNLDNMEAITKAFFNCKSSLGIDARDIGDVSDIPFRNKADLLMLLDKLESFTDGFISDLSMYRVVIKNKLGLTKQIKIYLQALVNTRPTLGMSLIDNVYLKLRYIDKVYLIAMIDNTSHTVKTISATLQYIKANIKQF